MSTSITDRDIAFQAWMSTNEPNLQVYAKAYAEKFRANTSNGINAYRQMELISASGIPMETARRMVSALLLIYTTGYVR